MKSWGVGGERTGPVGRRTERTERRKVRGRKGVW